MKTIGAFVLGVCLIACGPVGGTMDSEPPLGDAGSVQGSSDAAAGSSSNADAGSDAALPPTPNDGLPHALPLLSRGVPVFTSNGSGASGANDDKPDTAWTSGSLPASLAYDLSTKSAAERHQALVSWHAPHAPCYIDDGASTSGQRPIAYTLEVNAAAGGGNPPDTGWTTLAAITPNRYCSRQHLVDFNGANWIRMTVTEGSSDSPSVAFELDVQSAPLGASDSWLFMGDSITYMTLTHAFSDLPSLVQAAKPAYWPAVIDAAIGGTNTGTALAIIDDTMKDFPGRFVVLAYGTNDHPADFVMEGLVQKVIAAGKTPVVPHMPWSSGSTEGVAINQAIDALYAKYPQIIRGPDLWAFFTNRTDLIPMGEIHPNAAGQEALRGEWAKVMSALDP